MSSEDIFGLKPISPIRIAVVGRQCSGKTTLINMVNERLQDKAKIVKFAEPIYETLGVFGKNKNRRFMQGLGTLAMQCFGEKVFCEIFKKNVERLEETADVYGFLCDDVRRMFEFETVKKLDFVTVFLDTPASVRKKRASRLNIEFVEDHESEIYVDDMKELCNMQFDGNVQLKTMHNYADAVVIYANTVFENEL